MITHFVFMITIIFVCFSRHSFALESEIKRPFQVEDSINMVRLVDPDVALSAFYPENIKTSPDGKYFILATRTGNLVTGKNDYKLILYRSDQVLTFLNQKDAQGIKPNLPEAKVLAKVSTSHNDMPFQKTIWLEDSKTLAFIGYFDAEEDKTGGQVYKLDIHSGTMQKLTNHPRKITSFAINTASQRIIYASTISQHNKDRAKASYLVGLKNMQYIIDRDWEFPMPAVQYYIQKIGHSEDLQTVGQVNSGFFPTDIWLSPDGKQAIVLTTNKSPPELWLNGYDYLKNDFYRHAFKDFDENTMLPREDFLTQFSLLDISTGKIRPVFNAPTGLYVGGNIGVHWLKNSKSVILANTALPLNFKDKKERQLRSQTFSTVEYNIDTGTITPITHHLVKAAYRGPNSMEDNTISNGQFLQFNMKPNGLLRIEQVTDHWESLPDKLFVKENREWVQVVAPPKMENPDHSSHLILSIHQGLNTPPEIMARDRLTGRKKIITDLNPQFRNLTFGKTEEIHWIDSKGRKWNAGLLYPPYFKTGHKYPLVIQTHGFSPNEFLIDGPYGTASAFSAQALANKDMMVLQLSEPSIPQDQNELFVYQDGLEAAIDHLASKELIDKEKVGLIGWSSTGVNIQQMLLYSDYPIAAATIADAYNFGMASYVSFFGVFAPGMAFMEGMAGGTVPWGESLDDWVINNPTLHLDRLKTPLRYEQYGPEFAHWWSTYAILKRQQKPVEYYVFNDAAHALTKPQHRLDSQQGNVDWFAFWLKGEEDPDPTKADQYKRWRKLRVQQEKSEIAATQARSRDKSN